MKGSVIYQNKVLSVIKGLPDEKVAEVLDYATYLKIKERLKAKEITKFDRWAENLARRKGFSRLKEEDVIRIILETRKEKRAQSSI